MGKLGVSVGRLALALLAIAVTASRAGAASVALPVVPPTGSVPIDWECEFYYAQLLTPNDLSRPSAATFTEEAIPSSWTRYRTATGEHLPARNYATYRITCLVAGTGSKRSMGIHAPPVRSSYRMWINGEEAHSVGVVSSVPYEAKPRAASSLIPFQLNARKIGSADTVTIVLQVANFTSPRAGITGPLRIGDYNTLRAQLELNIVGTTLLIGMLLMLLIASLMLYALRGERITTVWNTVALCALMLAVATSTHTQLLMLFPSLSWDLYDALRTSSRLGTVAAVLLLLQKRYPYEFPSKIAYPMAALGGIATILVCILPSSLYLQAEWIGKFYIMASFGVCVFWMLPRAIKRKHPHAIQTLVCLATLGIAMAIDQAKILFNQPLSFSLPLVTIVALMLALIYITVEDISRALDKMRALMVGIRHDHQKYAAKNKELTAALEKEQQAREQLERNASRQQWSDEGQRALRRVFVDNYDDPNALCQQFLEQAARYVKSKVGVLYVARLSHVTNDLELLLLASYGLDEAQKERFATYQIGEGVVGSCFLDKTARHIQDIPKGSIAINSGLGRSAPTALVVQPLESDSGVVGVMELGRFVPYKEHELAFVECSAAQIANSIMHSNASENNRRLILQLQQQLEEKNAAR